MKPAVAITLITCGVIVVALPALWGSWNALMVSTALTHLTQPASVNIPDTPDAYKLGCWALGAIMIAVATVCSTFIRTADRRD